MRRLFSSCWITNASTSTMSAFDGESRKAIATAIAPLMIGPSVGMNSSSPAMSASAKAALHADELKTR